MKYVAPEMELVMYTAEEVIVASAVLTVAAFAVGIAKATISIQRSNDMLTIFLKRMKIHSCL